MKGPKLPRESRLPELKTCEMELALANHFGYTRNIIVPNISYGMGFRHELDLLVYTKSGFAWEIEIKISKADLVRDRDKKHQHRSDMIHRLYFAVPEKLKDLITEVPDRAGFIVVHPRPYGNPWVQVVRVAKLNPTALKWSEGMVRKLLELAAMRVWALKKHLYWKKSLKRV